MKYHIFEVNSHKYAYFPDYKQAVELNNDEYQKAKVDESALNEYIASFELPKDNKRHEIAKNINYIHSMYLCISNTCNARCIYCFAHQGNYGKKDMIMDCDTAYRAVDYMMEKVPEESCASIIFFGGEPLIAYDIIEKTVEYVKSTYADRKYGFSITTNGTLLNAARMKFLLDNNFKIAISIDGGETVQNEQRPLADGTNSFLKVKEILSPYLKNENRIIARGTYYLDRFSLADSYKDILGLGFSEANIVPDFIYMTKDKMDNLLWQMDRLHNFVLEYVSEHDNFPFGLITRRIRQLFLSEENNKKDCGLGQTTFSIDAYGDIYPCHRFSDSHETRIGTLTGEVYAAPVINAHKNCTKCWNKNTCSHGCTYEDYKSESNEFFCMYSRKMTEIAIALCNELPKEKLLEIIKIPKRRVAE